MKPSRSPTDEIAAAAALWLAKQDRGLTAEETRQFEAWRKADSRHAAEWASMGGTWDAIDDARAAPGIAAEAEAVDLRSRASARRRILVRRTLIAAAAIAVGFLVWPLVRTSRPGGASSVVFVASQARNMSLPDGSSVLVRGDTEILPEFTAETRRVRLARGEAYFSVAHDPSRPFVVETAQASVRAVGTAFNVRTDAGSVDVMVTEGRVQVVRPSADAPTPLLEKGQALRVGESAKATEPEIRAISPAEMETALNWRSPLLEFHRVSLPEVLAAFEQRASVRVELGDPALAQRSISGTFQADNIEGFLRLAELTLALRVERGSDGRVTLYPAR